MHETSGFASPSRGGFAFCDSLHRSSARKAAGIRPSGRLSETTSAGEPRGLETPRGRVAPKLLEAVVVARVRREDVDDHVEIVHEDPARLGHASTRRGSRPCSSLSALWIPSWIALV